ncbi:MAG: hypothetical protein ACYDEV_09280 [Acidiferrobacter sp.]
MSFSDWDEDEVARVHDGLLLLGWRADMRLTSDDASLARIVANDALTHSVQGTLSPKVIDELAVQAFDVMSFQLMNVDERAAMTTGRYKKSALFGPLVPLIDEAILCYYCGYYTAALATLFIICEQYLRQLSGWQPGMSDPSFATLCAAVKRHPKSGSRHEAEMILSAIYARYDAQIPPQFFFNRHGLLHGLRGPKDVDRMNCARILLLFDVLCSAEGLGRGLVYTDEFYQRHSAYEACVRLEKEKQLMLRN